MELNFRLAAELLAWPHNVVLYYAHRAFAHILSEQGSATDTRIQVGRDRHEADGRLFHQ